MRIYAGVLGFGLLAGCGGEGGGFVPFTSANIIGQSFAEAAPTILASGPRTAPVINQSVVIAFDSDTEATVTINGTPFKLTYDPVKNYLVDASGDIALVYGFGFKNMAATQDILTATVFDDTGSDTNVSFLTAGHNTTAAQFPTSGSAGYTGRVFGFDGALNAYGGDVALAMNFDSSTLTGNFDLTQNSNALRTDYVLVPAAVVGGAFDTTVTSQNAAVLGSDFTGDFYGATANQIAGTVVIVSPNGTVLAQFAAVQ